MWIFKSLGKILVWTALAGVIGGAWGAFRMLDRASFSMWEAAEPGFFSEVVLTWALCGNAIGAGAGAFWYLLLAPKRKDPPSSGTGSQPPSKQPNPPKQDSKGSLSGFQRILIWGAIVAGAVLYGHHVAGYSLETIAVLVALGYIAVKHPMKVKRLAVWLRKQLRELGEEFDEKSKSPPVYEKERPHYIRGVIKGGKRK